MGKLVSVSFGKTASKTPAAKPVPRSRRRRKPSLGTLIWSIVFLALTITLLIVQGSLMFIATLVAGLVTLLSAINDFTGEPPVPAAKPRSAKTTNPRGKGESGSAGRKPGTVGRKRTCSARCRASVKDKSTCNCVCGGRTHGIKAGPTSTVKEPKVPTTNKAKPIQQPAGERMRRVQ